MSPKKNPESPDTITGGKARGTVMIKDPATMIDTITKRDTTKAEETTVAEERKYHSVISMAKTKATELTNAPSPSRRKQSSSAKMPSKRS